MIIKDLIQELQKYDENMTVKVFDEGYGHLDITEVYEAKGTHINKEQLIRIDYDYIVIV